MVPTSKRPHLASKTTIRSPQSPTIVVTRAASLPDELLLQILLYIQPPFTFLQKDANADNAVEKWRNESTGEILTFQHSYVAGVKYRSSNTTSGSSDSGSSGSKLRYHPTVVTNGNRPGSMPVLVSFASVCRQWRQASFLHPFWRCLRWHHLIPFGLPRSSSRSSAGSVKPGREQRPTINGRQQQSAAYAHSRSSLSSSSCSTLSGRNDLGSFLDLFMLEPVRLCHVRSIVLDFAHNLHHIAYPSADIVANLLSCLHQPAELHTCIIYLPWHISGDDSLFSVLSSRFTCVKHLSIQGIGSREVLTGIEGKSLRRIVKTWPDGQLTHLALIGHGMGTFSAKTFMKLLEKNKSIKSLGFGYMRGTVDLDGIGKLLPQLESLSITFEYRSSANDTVGGDDEEVFEAYAYANFNRARGTGLRRSLHQYSEEILPELKGGLTQFHKLTSLTLQGASPLLPVPLEPITNVLVTLPGFKERLDELTRSAFSKQPSRTAPDPIPICNLSTLRLLNIHPSPSATSIPLVRVNTPAYLGLMTVFSDLPHLKSLSLPVVLCRTEVLVGLGASGCALENVAVHGEVEDSSGEEDDDGEREVSPLLRFKKIWPAMVVERF